MASRQHATGSRRPISDALEQPPRRQPSQNCDDEKENRQDMQYERAVVDAGATDGRVTDPFVGESRGRTSKDGEPERERSPGARNLVTPFVVDSRCHMKRGATNTIP